MKRRKKLKNFTVVLEQTVRQRAEVDIVDAESEEAALAEAEEFADLHDAWEFITVVSDRLVSIKEQK